MRRGLYYGLVTAFAATGGLATLLFFLSNVPAWVSWALVATVALVLAPAMVYLASGSGEPAASLAVEEV